MLSFDNTTIAFSDKTDYQLRKAHKLFWLVKNPFLVKSGSFFLQLANYLHFPLRWALKKTVFQHFCGGETLEECKETIAQLGASNIKAILDYAAEGVENEAQFEEAKERIIATIEMAKTNKNIGFAVFKFSGIARFELLEKISAQEILSNIEQQEYQKIIIRAREICAKAHELSVPVMIDAEETWIQETIDEIAEELMEQYNHQSVIVYHTLQMYRIDKLFYLKKLVSHAKEKKYLPGFKIVRGAYMEKERERAEKKGYSSPIHPNKMSTDAAFNDAIKFCIDHIEYLSVCIGSHNEESCLEATFLMDVAELDNGHPGIHFSQLKGMSDHISYNLAQNGYNVSKYVPYGPLKLVMPYLIRRAQENTSVAGQTSRELFLIKKELRRRRKHPKK